MEASFELRQSMIRNLRITTTWRLLIICLLATWLWMIGSLFGQAPEAPGRALAVLGALLIGTLVSYEITKFAPRWTMACFVANITCAITVALTLTTNHEFAYLYGIPVLVAGAFIHPWLGFAFAVLLNILLTAAPLSLFSSAGRDSVLAVAFLISGAAALLAWAFARDFHTVVDWMYQSYMLADERTREAREHRARLHETLRSLDLAYYRLQRTNEALNWARWQAEEARQAKARFAANVSHELRTPLNLIIGFSEMMVIAPESYGGAMPQAYRGDLNAIYRNAKHLSNLIDDVLDLSQIDAYRMPLNREKGDLRQIVAESANMIRGMVEAKQLALNLELPPQPVPLFVDITRIRQALLNLLNNAARYTETGDITVRLTVGEDRAEVTVTDTGAGINPEELERLFEEFYQVNDSIRREHGGTGLGLAISKRFVELHGGRIWANSAVGRGSTFGFWLPIDPLPRQPMQEPASVRRIVDLEGARERVLIVLHDDAATAVMLQRRLDTYAVKAVRSADEMVQAAARLRPTAILTDAKRREEAEAAMTAGLCGDIPLISCPLPSPPKMAKQLQTADYLLKPVTRNALQQALSRLPVLSKVLIADDDPAMVRLLARMVQNEYAEARILQARNGQSALQIARRQQPDLLLLDLKMPGLDGLGVLEQLRAEPQLAGMSVIIITATELAEQAVQSSGQLTVTVRRPLTNSEWMKMLQGVTAALRPVSDQDESSAPAFSNMPLG